MYIIIAVLMLLDYIFTYIGIYSGWAYEYNPFMVSFMEMPFIVGFTIRLVIVGLLLFYIYTLDKKIPYLYETHDKQKYKLYFSPKINAKKVLYVVLGIQITIMFVHVIWISHVVRFLMG